MMKAIKSIVSCFLLLSLVLIVGINVSFAEIDIKDYSIEDRAIDFLKIMYDCHGVEYNSVSFYSAKEMVDDENQLIAKVIIANRDNNYDYATYNVISDSIDEYGFDCADMYALASSRSKVYYGGPLLYYREVDGSNNLKDLGNNSVALSDVIKAVQNNKANSYSRLNEASRGNPESGFSGIISWTDVKNRTTGWETVQSGNLAGIDRLGSNGLSFSSMDEFASNTITNHCGPTALTNIMVYYKWAGKNTLKNNSRKATFNRLRVLCKHDKNNTTWLNDARTAITDYFRECGYSVSLTNFKNDFSKLKTAIENNRMVLTLLNVREADGDDWGHYVLSLGYSEYRQKYTVDHYFLGIHWTTTHYNYLRFARICDNWSSCNQKKYVDLNSFYSSYNNSAISFK